MVELDREDVPDGVAPEQRAARMQQLQRFGLVRIVVVVEAQMQMMEAIPRAETPPPPASESLPVELVAKVIAAGELVVNQHRVRGVDDALAPLPGAQAIVDVIVDDVVRFVEPALRLEFAAPDHEAGAGHGDDVALAEAQAEIARIGLGG